MTFNFIDKFGQIGEITSNDSQIFLNCFLKFFFAGTFWKFFWIFF